jgi:hypothetical protein
MKHLLLFIALILLAIAPSFADEFVNYPAPENAEAANDFELLVNGQKVFVYNTRAAAVAYFSFSGKVDIKVICNRPIYNHDIRPKSMEIPSSVYRDEIHFTLENPANFSVEVNKNLKRPLFIFANPLETNIPKRDDKNVIFFESGKIHEPEMVHLKSDQTVYIEGGAIVRGQFMTDKGKNITIRGRGILDNSRTLKGKVRPIEINQCENVLLEDIILTESRHWTCGSYGSKNVTYRNIKLVSENDWDDGIDIVGSQHVLVDGCFIRTKDDCIAIKGGVGYFSKFDTGANVDDIVVQNSVLWNGVWGNGLEIGFETRSDTINNILFKNIDLIHVEGLNEGTFTIHNGDRAVVKNVRYEDIRVEDSHGYLIDFKILNSQYSKDKERGYIQDVYFKNITVEGDIFPSSLIMGFDERHKVKNVTLDNFVIQGEKVTSVYNGKIAIIHAEGVEYK